MTRTLVGDPVDRIDGPLKVTGTAPYPSDVTRPGMAHAALVQSTIAAGTITRLDTRKADAAGGVLAVISHRNAPALAPGPTMEFGPSLRFPLKDDRVLHVGQHVAIVASQVRLLLSVSAYNLDNLLRRLVLAAAIRSTAPIAGAGSITRPLRRTNMRRSPWIGKP